MNDITRKRYEASIQCVASVARVINRNIRLAMIPPDDIELPSYVEPMRSIVGILGVAAGTGGALFGLTNDLAEAELISEAGREELYELAAQFNRALQVELQKQIARDLSTARGKEIDEEELEKLVGEAEEHRFTETGKVELH